MQTKVRSMHLLFLLLSEIFVSALNIDVCYQVGGINVY